jgi:hypothetical protein
LLTTLSYAHDGVRQDAKQGKNIQGVSGGILNILAGGGTDYSK